MLSLELITGEHPFSELRHDVMVVLAVANSQIPKHPAGGAFTTSDGLAEEMWQFMLKCWRRPEPKSRISMMDVKTTLECLRAKYYTSQSQGNA
jgi:hypothetical protein